jgi:catechol 2,3-dioxygenase-like lactoylglutathione lyase family enzyme
LINGAHVVVYTKDAEADRAFFRDVLQFSSVDAGHGWLIFAMPPLEVALHDSEKNDQHELFFMCDDMAATLRDLKSKRVKVSDVSEQRWGKLAHSSRRQNRPLRTKSSDSVKALALINGHLARVVFRWVCRHALCPQEMA